MQEEFQAVIDRCRQKPPSCGHLPCERRHRRTINLKRGVFVGNVVGWLYKQMKRKARVPKRNSLLSGRMWMNELWAGNEHRFFEQFRMRKHVMAHLISLLQDRYGFQPFSNVAPDESLAMLLLILGHGLTFPIVCERMQHSGQTVNAHFYEMLRAIHRMGRDIIKPVDPKFSDIPSQILHDRRYMPHFKDCVGAIDGTHIGIHITGKKATPFYNRKGVTTTNCLVACDFNMTITYAMIGKEGGLHDSRIFKEALNDVENRLPMPPLGKYYLGDSGYPSVRGVLVPYKKTRYHLPDFRRARVIRNADENFNYMHSSLRSCIERTFGILKERWKILRHMTKFPDATQVAIIYACMALHNFIRRYDAEDLSFLGEINGEVSFDNPVEDSDEDEETAEAESAYMNRLRDQIRDGMRFRT